MKFNQLVKVDDEALPQEVNCPGLEKTFLKNTYSPATGNPAHKQLLLI